MQLYKTTPITNNYRNKSEEQKAVDAMTANRSTIQDGEGNKRKSNSAINAMTTPSTAEVIKKKRS